MRLLPTPPCAGADQADPALSPVIVSTTSAGGGGLIRRHIAQSETEYKLEVFLHQSGAEPLWIEPVAGSVKYADGGLAKDCEIFLGGENQESQKPLLVLARNASLTTFIFIKLRVDSARSLFGELHWKDANGKNVEVRVDIDRSGTEPALRIAGLLANEHELKLASGTESFKRTLIIEPSGNFPVLHARARIGALSDPDGGESKLTTTPDISNDFLNISGEHPTAVDLDAELPKIGDYTAELQLRYAGQVDNVRIVIKRALLEAPVKLGELYPVRADLAVFGKGRAVIKMTLSSGDAQGGTVQKISLAGLTIKHDQTEYAADYDKGKATVQRKALGRSFQSNETLVVSGLRNAGTYTAKVRVEIKDAAPIERNVTLVLRDPLAVAVLCIALGVVLSTGYELYFLLWRPRARRQHQILELMEEADLVEKSLASPDETEREIIASLKLRLGRLLSLARNRGATLGDFLVAKPSDSVPLPNDLDTRLDDTGHRLALFPDWDAAWRTIGGLHSFKTQIALKKQLEGVTDYLISGPIQSKEGADNARKLLDGLRPSIRTAVKSDKIRAAAVGMRAAAKTRLAAAPTDLRRGAWQKLAEGLDALLAADGTGDLDEEFRKIRGEYIQVLSDDLEYTVSAAAPIGFEPANWQTLRSTVSEMLKREGDDDPEKDQSEYERALRYYLRSVCGHLDQALDGLERRVRSDPLIGPDDVKKFIGELESLSKRTRQLLAALDRDDFRTVGDEYADIVQEFEKLKAQVSPSTESVRGPDMAEGIGINFGAVPPGTSIPPFPDVSGLLPAYAEPDPGAARKRLDRLTCFWDLVAWLGILAVAVMLGLKLWFDSPTWGGWSDRTLAILWGLGLHQTSTVTTLQGGLRGVRSNIASKQS